MLTYEEIEKKLQENKESLFFDYPLKSLAIFGSYARKDYDENSDLDLLAEFNGKIGIRFVDLADELENLLGIKVDLVSKSGIQKRYMKEIEEDLIYV
jgi:predicted nucleotidyltransferase